MMHLGEICVTSHVYLWSNTSDECIDRLYDDVTPTRWRTPWPTRCEGSFLSQIMTTPVDASLKTLLLTVQQAYCKRQTLRASTAISAADSISGNSVKFKSRLISSTAATDRFPRNLREAIAGDGYTRAQHWGCHVWLSISTLTDRS